MGASLLFSIPPEVLEAIRRKLRVSHSVRLVTATLRLTTRMDTRVRPTTLRQVAASIEADLEKGL
jgi:hypothetical protein